jgi:hypothetical protein
VTSAFLSRLADPADALAPTPGERGRCREERGERDADPESGQSRAAPLGDADRPLRVARAYPDATGGERRVRGDRRFRPGVDSDGPRRDFAPVDPEGVDGLAEHRRRGVEGGPVFLGAPRVGRRAVDGVRGLRRWAAHRGGPVLAPRETAGRRERTEN